MTAVAPTLQAWFTERLATQKRASGHTIGSYRDTFRLLLRFAEDRTGKAPSALDFDDLGADLVSAFLDHLERQRNNSVRTRNARLAAIHSMYRFAALSHPEHSALIQRVLAIPTKGFERNDVAFWRTTRSMPCSPPPTGPPGRAGATTPSCSPPSKPGSGSQS